MKEEVERNNYLEFSSTGLMPPMKIIKHDCTKTNAEVFPQYTVEFGFQVIDSSRNFSSYSGGGKGLKWSMKFYFFRETAKIKIY